MSVEVAGGEAALVIVMFTLEFASVAGAPSMNQVMLVRGRLNSVMITTNTRGKPVTALVSFGAVRKTGPTVVNCRREHYWMCKALSSLNIYQPE